MIPDSALSIDSPRILSGSYIALHQEGIPERLNLTKPMELYQVY
jgi:hypothetical protein